MNNICATQEPGKVSRHSQYGHNLDRVKVITRVDTYIGFPSPADDYLKQRVLLHKIFLQNPNDSFIVQAQGDPRIGMDIIDKNYLVNDRSLMSKNYTPM